MPQITTRRATIDDASAVAEMADALLCEIMEAIGIQAFDSDAHAMQDQLCHSIPNELHFAFLAELDGAPVGFATLSAAYALYNNGPFGLITELFVLAEHRCQSAGEQLLRECEAFAATMGWSRLEVTTPPLPEFDRTLTFYQNHGFAITGGRKLKLTIQA